MPSDVGNKRKLSLKLKLMLFLGVPFLLLLIAAFSVDGFGHGELQAVIREARAGGGPFTLEEIQAGRNQWPEDQNGALVIVRMTARLEELSKSEELDTLPLFSANKMVDLGSRWTAEQDRDAGGTLDRLKPELAQIDQVRNYAGGRFPVRFEPNPITTLLPSLSPLRTAVRLKAAQAEYRVIHGDNSQVIDDVSIMFTMGQFVADEPMLISSLVRVACGSLTLSTIERICALTVLDPNQLEQLQKRVNALEGEDRISLSIRGERACFVGTFDYLRTSGSDEDAGLSSVPTWLARVPGLRGVTFQDEATGLRLFNRLVAVSGDRRKAMAIAKENGSAVQSLPKYCLLTRMMMPSLERAFELDVRHEATLRATGTALAAERFRLKTGGFPRALSELVPEYLDKVPTDPFDDQPLRYQVMPGKVVIYSVGVDLKDDEGLTDRPDKEATRDWGFTLLAPALRGVPASRPASAPGD